MAARFASSSLEEILDGVFGEIELPSTGNVVLGRLRDEGFSSSATSGGMSILNAAMRTCGAYARAAGAHP